MARLRRRKHTAFIKALSTRFTPKKPAKKEEEDSKAFLAIMKRIVKRKSISKAKLVLKYPLDQWVTEFFPYNEDYAKYVMGEENTILEDLSQLRKLAKEFIEVEVVGMRLG